ncbi:hypothetical protein BOTBODRAFT_176997 [Botryobasidium botryosum FD-172 SS1]|uniref:Cytochrome P450 n=1 Tax=Botryobasidium botryosum (strain FD-172 SS1) TaxID=930990 RepID=A0A067MIV9_BOTB1|nr:hypothetical protein BOTBODRAFT_176997 [Botryobasidium botryosum FD-172 SS1]
MFSTSHILLSTIPWNTVIWAAVGYCFVWPLVKGTRNLVQPLASPLRHLPGPENPSILWGNMKQVFLAESHKVYEKWISTYGDVLRFRVSFGKYRLLTTDTRAVSHILSHSYDFPKPVELRLALGEVVGEGLLFSEGDVHKRQRRIMNPSFGPAQIRSLTSIFLEKSQELRDIWLKKIAESDSVYEADVFSWLSRATLDIIGLAGFDYQFSALSENGEANELANALAVVANEGQRFSYMNILRRIFPVLKLIPDTSRRAKKLKESTATMRRIGLELVQRKKDATIAAAGKKEVVEKSNLKDRDLLSLLIKANMAADVPDSQRMSDEEVLAQISTFIVAGHETTSSSISWTLLELARHPEMQTKLRTELASVSTDNLTMDELTALPYLDAVVREALCFRAVVHGTSRIAAKDAIVPLSKPYMDVNGVLRHEVRMKKGDSVVIPISPLNRSKEIWGEDAHDFNPERWTNIPEKSAEIPSVYSHLGTFIAGAHACIGHRFAVVEIKALLFMLVRDISFELAVSEDDIEGRVAIINRPVVKSQREKGHQLPMLLRAARD